MQRIKYLLLGKKREMLFAQKREVQLWREQQCISYHHRAVTAAVTKGLQSAQLIRPSTPH